MLYDARVTLYHESYKHKYTLAMIYFQRCMLDASGFKKRVPLQQMFMYQYVGVYHCMRDDREHDMEIKILWQQHYSWRQPPRFG